MRNILFEYMMGRQRKVTPTSQHHTQQQSDSVPPEPAESTAYAFVKPVAVLRVDSKD